MTNSRKNAAWLLQKNITMGRYLTMLKDGSTFTYGDLTIKAHHTPGHTPGSVCYVIEGAMFTGDTLFAGGIGRCDLWGGDRIKIRESLQNLADLHYNYKIYPGHGASTSLNEEIEHNPYFKNYDFMF